MDISKRVVSRLERLVAQGPAQVGAVVLNSTQQQGYIVGVPAEGREPSVALWLQDYDRYSIALLNLEVSYGNRPAHGEMQDEAYLRHCADQVGQRLNYLDEPLELVELDADEGLAQLRSATPQNKGAEVIYWEAMVQVKASAKVSLTRYRWLPDYRERAVVIYPATFALLGRIAADLALSLSAEIDQG